MIISHRATKQTTATGNYREGSKVETEVKLSDAQSGKKATNGPYKNVGTATIGNYKEYV